jgi:hypothetical protein
VLTPELKQLADLTYSDFQCYPVWVGVHNMDYGKPWYDKSDESTYRPNTEPLPVAAERGAVLVRASFVLCDGERYHGFVRAASPSWDVPLRRGMATPSSLSGGDSAHALMGIQQPHIFVAQDTFYFWGGVGGVASEKRQRFYAALGKPAEAVFPIAFAADAGLATGLTDGEVRGFYRMVLGQPTVLEL